MSAQEHGHSDRLPRWFRTSLATTRRSNAVRKTIEHLRLNTVCSSAACPNRNECWNAGTATFMILGDRCTRGCRFCAVPKGKPGPVDTEEPQRVAAAVRSLKLGYAVVTSVTRDDLPDGGAGLFAETITAIRAAVPGCRVEVLIPDLRGDASALRTVIEARPDVLNHNIETVPSLYPLARPQADYTRSLLLLERARNAGVVTKTGLMLGLGEGSVELFSVLKDLRTVDCQVLTLGQYLQPSRSQLPVRTFYAPEEFTAIRDRALAMGFTSVVAAPLVRSSYHAEKYCSITD